MKQKIFVLWLTGLSASGKTTIAKEILSRFKKLKIKTHHLDGDEVRVKAKQPLGFSPADRNKNIQAAINLAGQYQSIGYVVIASFISPYQRHRQWGREQLKNYFEVFVSAPLEVCESRDPKGMYKKARRGELENFTGISDVYEMPQKPEIILETDKKNSQQCADEAINYLKQKDLI